VLRFAWEIAPADVRKQFLDELEQEQVRKVIERAPEAPQEASGEFEGQPAEASGGRGSTHHTFAIGP
jgi:hypothetical protein